MKREKYLRCPKCKRKKFINFKNPEAAAAGKVIYQCVACKTTVER